jgi:hypothetical protein
MEESEELLMIKNSKNYTIITFYAEKISMESSIKTLCEYFRNGYVEPRFFSFPDKSIIKVVLKKPRKEG